MSDGTEIWRSLNVTDLEETVGNGEQDTSEPEPISVLADLLGSGRLEVEELDGIGLRE